MTELTYSCVRPWRDIPRSQYQGKKQLYKNQGISELGKIVHDNIVDAIPPEGIDDNARLYYGGVR